MKLPQLLAALLLLTAASCASAPKPQVFQPVRQPAEAFLCAAWPVAPLVQAADAAEQLSVVHEQAEPAHVDCGCRLYVQGLAQQAIGAVIGELGPPPYGCSAARRKPESGDKKTVR